MPRYYLWYKVTLIRIHLSTYLQNIGIRRIIRINITSIIITSSSDFELIAIFLNPALRLLVAV